MAILNCETNLSERELEILQLVATGASNKEIASRLHISTNTVKVHVRNIFSKIGANSRTEAAMYAVGTGLVPGFAQAQAANSDELSLDKSNGVGIQVAGSQRILMKAGWIGKPGNQWLIGLLALLFVGILSFSGYFLWASGADTERESLPSNEEPRWQTLAPMPTARFGLAAAVHENLIYAIAGETKQGVTGVVERYDPQTDSWSSLADKPTAVADVSAAVVGGKIYVPGGRLSSGQATNVLEVYDPRLDVWNQRESLPLPVSGYALTAYEGKLYLFGGWDGENYLGIVYEYDPGRDIWSPRSSLSSPRAYAGAAVAGGEIYIMGGYDGRHVLSSSEIYQPEVDHDGYDAWTESAPLPEPRYGMGITSLAEIIYLVGGNGIRDQALSPQGYITQTGEWQQAEDPINKTVSAPALVALGTKIYVLGGLLDQVPVDQILSYKAIYLTVLPIVP
jgi:DNA-binding CsgD family transcriptional regulator